MKSQSPALTQGAIVATAGRKAHKVHRKLQQAEAELHTTNEILADARATPTPDKQQIEAAVQQSAAAEEKVHDATEELQVVKELLSEADGQAHAQANVARRSNGQTGDGVKSLIPHLERARSGATE
jgi:chromosome segregation ATPase